MVTITKNVRISEDRFYREAVCLSTDEKPTDGFANGSKIAEMDTGKIYRLNEERGQWLVWSSSGGDMPNIASDAEVDEALDRFFPN